MYYASFGILAVILHLIINNRILNGKKKWHLQGAYFRYGQFLSAILVFYIADLLWGFIFDSKIRILAYIDTSLFFAAMAVSVLLWTRFVVAYVDAHGVCANIFSAAGWLIFGFILIHLVVNIFNPIIFYFSEDMSYHPGIARYLILAAQVLLFISTSVYSYYVSKKRSGVQKRHYLTICLSGVVMAVLIILQSFDPFAPFYTIGCLLANCLVHVFIEEDEKNEIDRIARESSKEKERYSQIATSLARDYDAIYYIEIESGKYFELSVSDMYESMKVPKIGCDFYEETRENARRYAHPDDRAFAESFYYKEVMLKKLEGQKSYSYRYRIMVGGHPRYFQFVVLLSSDAKHFILCDKDISDTITAETALLEKQKAQITFSHIAESLAANYDMLFYVDLENNSYAGYSSNNSLGKLHVEQTGEDFFDDIMKNMSRFINPQEREKMTITFDKDYFLTALEDRKQVNLEYSFLINEKIHYTRMSVRKISDGLHLIICVENIDDEIKKENEIARALQSEKNIARRDELTGVKNKLAFDEFEKSIQDSLDKCEDPLSFALVVCDLNDLKKINDTQGHKAGDEYIKTSAKLLCNVFDHSPVFRIGGDEFAIFLSGEDYSSRHQLVEEIQNRSIANIARHEGPVIAIGMAEYMPETDHNVTEIFERADRLMYKVKKELKSRKYENKN
ncbi:diguanylate cyclase (GGDEF) domain-containing protein [Lachnospiraceae bacterium]|nr:diguanylate cyclase (GGDEF) domain-containing protein [Lachnospiraceae bacterium]